ncbi:MAG: OstA-like protein [Chitinophagaceae bacterium]
MHRKLTYYCIVFLILLGNLQIVSAQQNNPNAPRTTTTVAGDTTRIVEILHSNKLNLKKPNDTTDLQILVGDVRLKQGTSLFYCDSCVIDNLKKVFEAFGHVHINDSDTTDIYSDYLRYLTQTKKAYFNGNVKLTDGHGELTTPDMDYDMNTKVGTYTKGGTVKNKKSVLTSQEGIYYADLKDVYFKKNVVLVDPAYRLTADSLLYSTAFETVRFITETVIIDSSKRKITTKSGYYDLKQGKAEFGDFPVVQDGKTTVRGRRIAFNDSTGISEALGSAVVVDSVNGTTIYADKIFRNRKTEAILATVKPIMIIKQESDSIYVTADTLFSARLTDLNTTPASFRKDSTSKIDSSAIGKINAKLDSAHNNDSTIKSSIAIVNDSVSKKDTGLIQHDSTGNKLAIKIDSLSKNDTLADKTALIKTDSLNKAMPKPVDSTIKIAAVSKQDSTLNPKISLSKKEKRGKQKLAIPVQPASDTTANKNELTGATVVDLKETDSTNRYFEGYSHVRIYSDSMQAVGDSMFYSFHDSTFRLFKDPIVWSKGSQITGDTIFMVTKNKQPDHLKVWNNSFLVNHLEKEAFNQIKSSRMDAYFLDGEIDSVRAKGSAECIYFMQDKDSAYTGINQSQSDIMDVYFKLKEIERVVFRSSVKGTLWPIRQKKPEDMRLSSFKWLEARRPKTKYELFE